jgi:hypothetical protein
MTSIHDPIRQASLFTTGGLVDPRLMPGYAEKLKERSEVNLSSPWWLKMVDLFSFGKRPSNV